MNYRDDRGATVVVVAVSLLMLLGFAALAIDGSLGLDDRRGTQNAADAAALAAAWEYCNSSGPRTPEQAAIDKASENGYTHNAPDFPQVNVTGSGDTWTVEIIEENQGVFGGATPFAPDELTIVSGATARCFDEGVLGGYALFSQTSACPGNNDLSVTSSDIDILGGVHANDDVQIQGSSPSVSGELTYRDVENVDASLAPAKYFGSPEPYPLDLTIDEYLPGSPPSTPPGTRAAAAGADFHDLTGANITVGSLDGTYGIESGPELILDTAGIYFTDRDVSINKTLILTGDAAARGVTFVAEGKVSISSAENLAGFDPLFTDSGPKLLLFANDYDPNPRCNPDALSISGSDVIWEGVMFAPFGPASVSASGNSTVDGSILAYEINLSGGSIQITYDNDPDADPNFRVELLS